MEICWQCDADPYYEDRVRVLAYRGPAKRIHGNIEERPGSHDLDAIFPYYGYCNDMLIKLNTFQMRVMDVVMPARYGMEKSKIKYSKYIMKVAPMIFRGFLWRLKTKYVILDFHPLVFFYLASMVLVPVGVLFGMWIFYHKWNRIPVSANFPLLDVFILIMGLQFLLFAMLFDMQADNSRSNKV